MNESPFADIEVTLRAIRFSMERAATLPIGSKDALDQLGSCLMTIGSHFAEHTKAAFPRAVTDPLFQADAERALDLFVMIDGFPGEMAGELRLAMAGLQIGEVRDSLRSASRQGGLTNLYELHLKSIIVGAADYLMNKAGKHEVYRAELERRGLDRRTIETYRKQIKRTDVTGKNPVKFISPESMESSLHWAQKKLKSN
jgi:hypothetical protein